MASRSSSSELLAAAPAAPVLANRKLASVVPISASG